MILYYAAVRLTSSFSCHNFTDIADFKVNLKERDVKCKNEVKRQM